VHIKYYCTYVRYMYTVGPEGLVFHESGFAFTNVAISFPLEKCRLIRSMTCTCTETGKIIPSVYGSWRNNKMYDPFKDPLRSNLYEYEKDHKHTLIARPT
jgi:hypothetical protein